VTPPGQKPPQLQQKKQIHPVQPNTVQPNTPAQSGAPVQSGTPSIRDFFGFGTTPRQPAPPPRAPGPPRPPGNVGRSAEVPPGNFNFTR
jgi:hypothetical protein